ncbi:MAG: ABC transporter permease [Lachnospiraceae bacterium]|nr:ABC transporter permease [Lachnospiraceae bacterium]
MVCKKLVTMEQHDYGIYKSLGFTSARLRTQFSLRFILIGILGVAVGIGVSICLNKRILGFMLKSMGITNFNANYVASSIIMPMVIMCVTLFVCSFFASRRIKSVSTKVLIVE